MHLPYTDKYEIRKENSSQHKKQRYITKCDAFLYLQVSPMHEKEKPEHHAFLSNANQGFHKPAGKVSHKPAGKVSLYVLLSAGEC
jgi:hypothetical protein